MRCNFTEFVTKALLNENVLGESLLHKQYENINAVLTSDHLIYISFQEQFSFQISFANHKSKTSNRDQSHLLLHLVHQNWYHCCHYDFI
jgi:hypothetical protein